MVRRLHDQNLSGYRVLKFIFASALASVACLGLLIFYSFGAYGYLEGKLMGSGSMMILILVSFTGFFLAQFFVVKHFFLKPGTAGPNQFGLPQ